jgi:hypothetical protein
MCGIIVLLKSYRSYMFKKFLQNQTTIVEEATPSITLTVQEMMSQMGFESVEGLIGINESVNKPFEAYCHPLIEKQTIAYNKKYYNSKKTSTGVLLFDDDYVFNNSFLKSNLVEKDGTLKTLWAFTGYEKLSSWVDSFTGKKSPSSGWYSVSLTESEMTKIVASLYEVIMPMADNDTNIARRLIGFLITNGFQSAPVMSQIAKESDDDKAKQYIETLIKVRGMHIPISDYYLVYETMDDAL